MHSYRQEFFDFAPVIYLDCAYQGPFPRVTVERIQQAIELKTRPDRLKAPEYFDLPQSVRARIARLTGSDVDQIAITTSATQGIGIAASGLTFSTGDEVVVASSNFPSNLFTWLHLRRRGVTVKVVHTQGEEVTLDAIAAELTPRTRVLALDWVDYSTGCRIDLAAFGALIHDRGGIFVVDGTQGVGANELKLSELPVDLMACGAYKWLLGPYGTGFAYVAKDLLDRLDLQVVNWYSVEGADDFDLLPSDEFRLVRGASVFDSGETGNFMNLHALDASLEFVECATIATVNKHCVGLLRRLAEGLSASGYKTATAPLSAHASTILCFRATTPEATATLHRKLAAEQIAVSLRQGMIRVSPYLYNDEAEIDRLLEVVRPA